MPVKIARAVLHEASNFKLIFPLIGNLKFDEGYLFFYVDSGVCKLEVW